MDEDSSTTETDARLDPRVRVLRLRAARDRAAREGDTRRVEAIETELRELLRAIDGGA